MENSTRLGRHHWVVERSFAWLTGYRRLTLRYERSARLVVSCRGMRPWTSSRPAAQSCTSATRPSQRIRPAAINPPLIPAATRVTTLAD